MSETAKPWAAERRALQGTVLLLALVPLGAGLWGALQGPAMLQDALEPAADSTSHWRYLSGLLFAIGLGFCSCVPRIERRGRRFRLLAGLVVLGGLGRLYGVLQGDTLAWSMWLALAMELAVTPLLAVWQWRVARRVRR